jgi:acyl carrier protein
MTDAVEARVKRVMGRIFKVPESDIGEETSPDTMSQWGSLRHMELVMALEEEFGVRFSENQIVELLSYPLVLATLREVLPS